MQSALVGVKNLLGRMCVHGIPVFVVDGVLDLQEVKFLRLVG